jgi:6-phosphogluconolactonase
VDQTNSGVLPQRLVPVIGVVFSDVTTANPAQSITSNTVTVGGVGTGVVVRVVASAGTTIIKNGVAVVGQLAIAQDGDTLALRVTALGTGQSTTSTLSVGSTSVQWSVTSMPLGGAITGVAGTGLVLQDNLGDTVTVAAGSSTFGFSSMISNGQPYSITVMTAPTSPLQSCAVVNGSGTVGATQAPITVACSLASEIAVAANSTTSNISVYAVDPTTGALSPVPGSPFATGATPKSVAVDATGQYVLVANSGSSNISVYSINTTNGFLTPVAGSPFLTGTRPTGVTVDAVSNVIYVPESASDTIAEYSINPTNGALTAISGSPFATPLEPGFDGVPQAVGNLSPVIIDATGGYLYASYQYDFPRTQTATGFLGYSIGANGGGLSLLPSNPFAAAIGSCFCIRPMAIAPNGHFLYQSTLGIMNYVQSYSVDASTGALSALTGTPFAATGADSIAIDPTSSFLYVSDDTDIALLAYSINSTTGALTLLPGSPYATGGDPNCMSCGLLPTFVSIDSSGKYVYVQSEFTTSSSIISAFSINAANGSLTPVPGSPFTTAANPEGLVGIAFAPIPQ